MKKSQLGLFAALLIATTATAQEKKPDSTIRPGAYKLRTGLFKTYPNSKKDLIFLGNSITQGVDWAELLQNKNARNRGISGDITFGVLERLGEVTEGKPAKVFILIGINDIQHNFPDTVIVNNYRRIIRQIKAESPKTKIYFHTLLPVNNEFTQFKHHYNKDEHILFVNTELKKIAAAENITLIDLHPHFLDASKKLDKRYTHDGLHLNAEGYKVWAEILKQYL
ncbi:GDSL-type esterase/lipase family protein [Niastella populi]|uniref:Sialate O-acetylesterase n=1 Tax=Niastella populi TaxID=550983 RepID=A0A1V9G6A9_9BACT|nr:GDSL-type esterase/lipase family protein [Niastella populi]OQP66179.1 sialate O-acetylesterase [Niastella populi]